MLCYVRYLYAYLWTQCHLNKYLNKGLIDLNHNIAPLVWTSFEKDEVLIKCKSIILQRVPIKYK